MNWVFEMRTLKYNREGVYRWHAFKYFDVTLMYKVYKLVSDIMKFIVLLKLAKIVAKI